MSEYTPTTREVARVYSLAPVNLVTGGKPNPQPEYARAQFDRWLAAHDAEVLAADALAASTATPDEEMIYVGTPDGSGGYEIPASELDAAMRRNAAERQVEPESKWADPEPWVYLDGTRRFEPLNQYPGNPFASLWKHAPRTRAQYVAEQPGQVEPESAAPEQDTRSFLDATPEEDALAHRILDGYNAKETPFETARAILAAGFSRRSQKAGTPTREQIAFAVRPVMKAGEYAVADAVLQLLEASHE